MCVISTQFAPQEPKNISSASWQGQVPPISSSCASPRRFLLWSWSIAGGRRGRHQIMEWWNGGGQVANMTRFTLIIRARRASPSLPVRSHIRQNCLPIHCQRDIRERESNQEARSGERGREEQSSGRCSSLCPSASVRPSHRSSSPATAITFLCCPLLIKHFYLVQVCTRRDAHCSRHLPLALLRRPSSE